MLLKNRSSLLIHASTVSWFDLMVMVLLIAGGFFYLQDYKYWGFAFIGDFQFGDAYYWWDSAMHIAQGSFKDNPLYSFRPGYYFLTGLTLPIIGLRFEQFYPYFLFTFLLVITLFYLSLRNLMTRLAAVCVAAMVVFNPFTAEWITTSTSDGTGLILHIASLACLLWGVTNGLRMRWLVAFSILFAIATLTRPILTPFIGLVIIALLILPKVPFKKRILLAVCVAFSFFLPITLWMGVQKLIINEWTISSNEASAFYAASDPQIQVWNGPMYDPIKELASKQFQVKEPEDWMVNRVFWQETFKNYVKYPMHHLKRIGPHIKELVSISPKIAVHGTNQWQKLFMAIIAFGMAVNLILQNYWRRSLIFLVISYVLYIRPDFISIATLSGAVIALFVRPGKTTPTQLGIFLLTVYWLVGVAALYFVGGTWGPPLSSNSALTSLGYRLGSQLFFVGDLLAAYFLVWLACTISTNTTIHPFITNRYSKIVSFFTHPSRFAGKIVFGFFGLFCTALLCVYAVGSSIVFKRSQAKSHVSFISYPNLTNVIDWYQKINGTTPIKGEYDKGKLSEDSMKLLTKNNAELIFTGVTSSFVWNLQGQNRSLFSVYTQTKAQPQIKGHNSLILEVPQYLVSENWEGKQGAFIIAHPENKHITSTLPYYMAIPMVKAFVPLTPDKRNFDIQNAIVFPLVKNATSLVSTGELQFKNANITWTNDSGPLPFQRRFYLTPGSTTNLSQVELLLNVKKSQKGLKLSFSYIPETKNESVELSQSYNIEILANGGDSSKPQQILLEKRVFPTVVEQSSIRNVEFVIPPNSETIKITFNELPVETKLWFYEFNLHNSFNLLSVLAMNKKRMKYDGV